MQQQALFRLLAHALDLVQGALDGRLGPQVAVEGDAEAVRFVADTLEHLQGLGIPVDKQRIRVPYPDYFFQPLGQADYRHAVQDAQFGEGLMGKFQLSLATVNHNELREVFRILGQHTGIAAVHHLLHGGVIVGADHRLDLEAAVVLLGGFCIAEHHARGHRVGTLDVGVVEALHMARQHRHIQRLLQFLHHAHPESVRIRMLPLLDAVEVELLGVLRAQLQQGQLVSPLRYLEFHARYFNIRQEGHDHLFGQRTKLVFNFPDKGRQHSGLLLLDLAFEAQIQALDDGPAPNAQEIAEGFGPVEHQGEDIGISIGRLGDDAFGVMTLQTMEFVFVHLRLLEGQATSGIGHQGLVMPDHFPAPAAQDAHDLLDVIGIFLL